MRRTVVASIFAILIVMFSSSVCRPMPAADVTRFFFSGDGRINFYGEKSGEAFNGQYRSGLTYDPAALATISRVFGAPLYPDRNELSLRLIEYLDLLQDRLAPNGRIIITSGYRHPTYNTALRNKGRLAAKASLHQYGMAADVKMEGVPARRLWEYVKELGFGGAGYYHGETVHVDVGPSRSWDEKTSGVGTGISEDNKLIGIVTDFDRYRSGDTLSLRFIRMTAFPIGVVPQFELIRRDDRNLSESGALVFIPSFATATNGNCPSFADIDQMARVRWRLPSDLAPGRYAIRTRFCGGQWKDMPEQITTPDFEIYR